MGYGRGVEVGVPGGRVYNGVKVGVGVRIVLVGRMVTPGVKEGYKAVGQSGGKW